MECPLGARRVAGSCALATFADRAGPNSGSCDEGGSWSGSASEAEGAPVILDTGVDIPAPEPPGEWHQVVCLATSSDGMVIWRKDPRNPVIDAPAAGLNVTGFPDPTLSWKCMGVSGNRPPQRVLPPHRALEIHQLGEPGSLCRFPRPAKAAIILKAMNPQAAMLSASR